MKTFTKDFEKKMLSVVEWYKWIKF
jgi:hypothetical protein